MRGTTILLYSEFNDKMISIHVPREGHDRHRPAADGDRGISIHVPREGHDLEAKT